MPERAQKLVMVVDDDPDFLEFVSIVLEAGGYEVRTAATADAALQAMQSERPDLVIVDVMMSYAMDGWSVSRRMSVDTDLSAVPVLMVSAIVNEKDEGVFPNNGHVRLDAFMSKPLDPSTLLRRVAELTGSTP
jgi:two-component system, OmpR family, alkaline phosphatase synthesis response regulator PhoP